MVGKKHLALIGSSIICFIGLTEDSTAVVIGSMAIAPLVEMVLDTLKNNPGIGKWIKLVLWILVPIIIGCLGQIAKMKWYDKYILDEKHSQRRTRELLKRTGQWKNIYKWRSRRKT